MADSFEEHLDPPSPQEDYFGHEDAVKLWEHVRRTTNFQRHVGRIDAKVLAKSGNRLVCLVIAAIFRRVEHLVEDQAWFDLLRVLEAYTLQEATSHHILSAYEKAERVKTHGLSAVQASAMKSIHLAEILRGRAAAREGLDGATDAAGYCAAIEAGALTNGVRVAQARSVWDHPAFLQAKWKEELTICHTIRDILGDPYKPAPELDPVWLCWNDHTISKLAQSIHDENRFPEMPILADALEEAGCSNAEVLAHCRETEMHVRGCWVLDWLLGKY